MYLVISIPAQIFFTFGLAGGLNTFTPHGLLKIIYSIVRLEKNNCLSQAGVFDDKHDDDDNTVDDDDDDDDDADDE